MIYDTLENAQLYFRDQPSLLRALAHARDFDIKTADGRYEIDTRGAYMMVSSYQTTPAEKRLFEAHQEFIDVQVVLEGQERADVAVAEKLEIATPYSLEKDVMTLKPPAKFSSVILKPGYFAVFYPQDIHRPGCNLNGSSSIRKLVFKIPVTEPVEELLENEKETPAR